MNMDQMQRLFIAEAEELLVVMEQCLLDAEAREANIGENIDAIFRAAHTIKGSAGLFGFESLVAFAHDVENVLDAVRSGELAFSAELVATLLDCHQYMSRQVAAIRAPQKQPDAAEGEALSQALNAHLCQAAMAVARNNAPEHETDPIHSEPVDALRCWLIDIIYHEDVLRDGMDPLSQLQYLNTLGEIHQLRLESHFPNDDDAFNPESCYLSLHMEFDSCASLQEIEDTFEFIRNSCQIHIVAQAGSAGEATDDLANLPSDETRPAAYRVADDDKVADYGALALQVTKSIAESANSPVNTVIEAAIASPVAADSRIQDEDVRQGVQVAAAAVLTAKTNESQPHFVKVDAQKLDDLIKLVGEMVTTATSYDMLIKQTKSEVLSGAYQHLLGQLSQFRDGVLDMRMVPIADTFRRLRRVVRDVGKELGKEVYLDIQGDTTELDKTILESLFDPLVHLVRNALDHGIEPEDIRLSQGKPAQGCIRLNAYHEAGTVVIELSDDGAGINTDKVYHKAVQKGLLSAQQTASRDELCNLIFAPGFSTSDTVTHISGRGVGMDVVKRNIESLQGHIQINSLPSRGTLFTIRLPLTLSIIDGFQVSVGDTQLVVPANAIQECLAFESASMTVERDFLNLRGQVMPFVRLRDILRLQPHDNAREHIVVVQFGDKKVGLLVEELQGELQAVLKPLGPMFKGIRGIGGSTILGNGSIGFVLDIPRLIQFATRKELQRLEQNDKPLVKVAHG